MTYVWTTEGRSGSKCFTIDNDYTLRLDIFPLFNLKKITGSL